MQLPTITIIQDFLDDIAYGEISEFAMTHPNLFQPSATTDNRPDLRQSSIMYNFPFEQLIKEALNNALPTILSQLQLLPFPVEKTENQLTATGNEGFYSIHNDNGSAQCARRLLSYVYYCHANPKRFRGGELKVYGHEEITYEPVHNQLVCFSASHQHEVLPVSNNGKWENSRFTINGWFTMGSFDKVPELPIDDLPEMPLQEMATNFGAIS